MKKKVLALLLAVFMVVSFLPVTVSAKTITASGGSNLQTIIKNASSGDTIKLTGDYTNGTPASENNYIMIQKKSLTIDLNGHTINAGNKGQRVIYVSGNGTGKLTIEDSAGGGKITGGKANDSGGGAIYLDTGATLTMYGGSITGNTSIGDGSAINIHYGAVANIYGGEVCNNKTLTSGKDRPIVLASKSGETTGALYLGGTVKIYGNKKSDGSLRNLGAGGAVHIVNTGTNALKEGAEIWLNDGSFTNDQQITGTVGGYLTPTNYQYFFADPDFSVIYKNSKFYAHKHNNWTYTASGATLTANCKTCSYTVPLTVSAPANANYDGTTNRAKASLDSAAVEKWNRIVNGTGGVSAPSITYTNSAGQSVSQAINGGTYYANIKAGSATAKAAFTVNRIAPNAAKLSYTAPESLIYDGNDHAPTFAAASGVTGLGNISVDYYLLNEEKVESAKMPGEYTVYAKVDDTGCNYTAANGLTSSSWKFTIVKNTSTVTINAEGESFTYGDTDKTGFKELSVTDHEDFDLSSLVKTYYKETATAGVYESTGSTTVPTDVGNYKVVISVPDTDIHYEGSKSVTFSIAPKALTESDVEAISDVAYTGSELKPTVVVKDGEKTLAENTDYAVTYTDNTEVGTATATITLCGNYTGTINKSFNITKVTPTITTTPTASEITYGQTLADSTLTGGVGSVEGTFAWATSTIAPAVSDSETTEYEVTFTPKDTANYNTATCKVTVKVNAINYDNVTTEASVNLNAANGSTEEITLPEIPTGASYGNVENSNTEYFTVSAIAGGKVTVTSAKEWDKTVDGTSARTFTVTVNDPSGNHNSYAITVSVTPVYHTHVKGTEYAAKNATCTEKGNVLYYDCTGCEKKLDADGKEIAVIEIAALGHNFNGDYVQGTGENANKHARKCERFGTCGALGNMIDTAATEGYVACSGGTATCTKKAVCEKCNNEYGDVLGHDFKEQIIDNDHLVSAATCTAKAVYYYDCSRCDVKSDKDTFEYGDVLGHDFKEQIIDNDHLVSAATCTAKAVYYYDCSRCDVKSSEDTFEYGDVLGHDFKEQIIDNDHLVSAATCTAKAVYYYDCSRCDVKSDKDTFEYGNMLDHSYKGDYVDNGNGTHSRKCVNGCNAYGNPTDHTGMEDFICDDCGYEDIAAAKEAKKAQLESIINDPDCKLTEVEKEAVRAAIENIEKADTLTDVVEMASEADQKAQAQSSIVVTNEERPSILVDKTDFDKLIIDNFGKVSSSELIISEVKDAQEFNAIKKLAGDFCTVEGFDATLFVDGVEKTDLNGRLAITVGGFSAEGKTDINVLRTHDGVASKLSFDETDGGEYFEIVEGKIVLHVDKLCTFAVSYVTEFNKLQKQTFEEILAKLPDNLTEEKKKEIIEQAKEEIEAAGSEEELVKVKEATENKLKTSSFRCPLCPRYEEEKDIPFYGFILSIVHLFIHMAYSIGRIS